jgi:predicted ATPase/DNA-binding SARP family transcriptional activator
MRIGILGPLEVRDADGILVPVGGARLRSLLIRLAVDDGRPVSVERLADDLWADEGPADAANAIQALVSRLRGAAGRDIVEFGPAGYRLAVAADDIDARVFEQLVGAGRGALADGDQAAGAARLRQALGLWRGPALADVADAPFAAAAITGLSEMRLAATEDRIGAELALGRGGELVPELEGLAAAHPLRERLRGQLMQALYAAGRQADALAAYEDTRQTLAEQLGVDPSPGLAAVHLAILRGEASPPAPSPPAGAAAPRAAGASLPAQLTSFVGREDELRRLGKLLGESRLVTLTGPGGAGKTRLSVEACARMADELPDGVWFVPLAPVRDALDVPAAVLTAIGLQDPGWLAALGDGSLSAVGQPLDRLADALEARRLIIVLDNCEHLVDAVAWLASRVLAQAPGVRILVTSREPLGVTGETLCPVPSLPLPEADAGPEEAGHSAAVRLFCDRAAAVRPGFALDEQTAEPVVRICRALDGIPLAIELAAARLRALTAAQVADRLDDRFRLLSVTSRGTLPRHQTLRAIVDWSWELLDDAERTILRRLSVFSGGATPESAEQVCGPAKAGRDVIDVIAALVDKSLVVATGENEVRYRLLETMRAYAGDRLAEAGEADEISARHAAFFLELAERAEPEMRARDQLRWLDKLAAEHDNCAAALRYVIAAGDGRSAVRFVAALAWFWVSRDYDTEAGEWAQAVRELVGDTPPDGLAEAHAICQLIAMMSEGRPDFPSPERMREVRNLIRPLAQSTDHPLLAVVGPMLGYMSGDIETARQDMRWLAEHRDPWIRAAHGLFAGHIAIHYGHIDEAAAELAAGHARFQEIGDRWGMIICLVGQADVATARDQPAEAVRLLEEARRLAASGLAANFGEMMSIPLAKARALAGDPDTARIELERGAGIAGRIGEHDDQAAAFLELSELARRDGDLAHAQALVRSAMAVIEPRGRRPDMVTVAASAFTKSGCIAEQEGDLAAAARWHAQALGLLNDAQMVLLPSNQGLAAVVEGIAALSAARGEPDRAAELLGLAHELQGYCNKASLEVGRARAAVDRCLAAAEADAAYARGRRLTRADALALIP